MPGLNPLVLGSCTCFKWTSREAEGEAGICVLVKKTHKPPSLHNQGYLYRKNQRPGRSSLLRICTWYAILYDPRPEARHLGRSSPKNTREAGRTGQTWPWGRRFDQRREPLPRKAMVMVVVMSSTTRQRGKRQGDKGLRAELALETPTETTCTRRALRTSKLFGHPEGHESGGRGRPKLLLRGGISGSWGRGKRD